MKDLNFSNSFFVIFISSSPLAFWTLTSYVHSVDLWGAMADLDWEIVLNTWTCVCVVLFLWFVSSTSLEHAARRRRLSFRRLDSSALPQDNEEDREEDVPCSKRMPCLEQERFLRKSHSSLTSSSRVTFMDSDPSFKGESIAMENGECPICFTLLHKEPIASCTDFDGVATCLHFYHTRCLKTLLDRRCVVCNMSFLYLRKVPDLEENPKLWFQVVDVDRSGGLAFHEVSRVLTAQLPIDKPSLERVLRKRWSTWDSDNNGEISLKEFFSPRRGLLTYLKKKRGSFKLIEPIEDPPDIRDDAQAWFEYFDKNNTGTLDKIEVLRGLILSFGLSQEPRVCLNFRRILDCIWVLFDTDLDGQIDKHEFLTPKYGLADSIIASLQHRGKKTHLHA